LKTIKVNKIFFDALKKAGFSEEKIMNVKKDFKVRDTQARKYLRSKRHYFEEIFPKYRNCLENATCEEDVQAFLTENPVLAMEVFCDGAMPLDIIPKFKLGQDFITDFTVLGIRSFGSQYHIIMVEIESPLDNPFTKEGIFSQHLNHAIKQVMDWDSWLRNKFETFCADLPEKLTIYKIDNLRDEVRKAFFTYKIVIGRRENYNEANRDTKGAFFHSTHGQIEIMSFDRILDVIEKEINDDKK